MSGRARSLTRAFFFARKSARAWSRSCTSWSTSELGSVSMTATLYSRSCFRRGAGRRSCQPAPSISSAPAIAESAECEIVGAPRQGADDGDVGLRHAARQRLAARRHDAVGRLVAEDAAVVRGVPDRRADVAPRLDARQAGGERRGRAAGGAARRAPEIPGIVGGAVHRVVALPVGEHERHIALAEEHHARAEQAVHGERIARRPIVLELGRPHVVGMPTTSYDSFTVMGTPWSGPQAFPFLRAASAARARRRAPSRSVTTMALSRGLYVSTRAR